MNQNSHADAWLFFRILHPERTVREAGPYKDICTDRQGLRSLQNVHSAGGMSEAYADSTHGDDFFAYVCYNKPTVRTEFTIDLEWVNENSGAD